MQAVIRPSLYGIKTLSTVLPSCSRYSRFRVPSWLTSSVTRRSAPPIVNCGNAWGR
jgi:hypothetical protein